MYIKMERLDYDVLYQIISEMNAVDITNFCLTSSGMYRSFCDDPMLWRMLLRRDFHITTDDDPRQFYIELLSVRENIAINHLKDELVSLARVENGSNSNNYPKFRIMWDNNSAIDLDLSYRWKYFSSDNRVIELSYSDVIRKMAEDIPSKGNFRIDVDHLDTITTSFDKYKYDSFGANIDIESYIEDNTEPLFNAYLASIRSTK